MSSPQDLREAYDALVRQQRDLNCQYRAAVADALASAPHLTPTARADLIAAVQAPSPDTDGRYYQGGKDACLTIMRSGYADVRLAVLHNTCEKVVVHFGHFGVPYEYPPEVGERREGAYTTWDDAADDYVVDPVVQRDAHRKMSDVARHLLECGLAVHAFDPTELHFVDDDRLTLPTGYTDTHADAENILAVPTEMGP